MRQPLGLAVCVLGLLGSPSSAALSPQSAAAEYQRLQKWQFSQPVPLTAPVTLERDTASWTLESGSVRLMEPLADGTVTGLVFEGRGRFRMSIPDRYEVAQLRRFSGRDIDAIDQPFTQLVLRTSDPALARRFAPVPGSGFAPYGPATKRHESWLVDTFEDIDARIIEAMLNGSGMHLTADMKTADFDWLTYHFDPAAPEEIRVVRPDPRNAEIWISLDRPQDRDPAGRPAPATPPASLDHIDVKADLTRLGSQSVGANRQRLLQGRYVVEGTFTGIADRVAALRLGLSPRARDVTAYGEDGAALTVFRDAIGKRSLNVDNRDHDDEFVVVLSSPLVKGARQKVRFAYELETANYAPGRAWYPTIPGAFEQRHTARLELTVRRRNELRSMGRMEKRTETGDAETSLWIVERPTKMVTFSTATRFEEVKVEATGIPPVFSFGPDYQFTNTQKLRNVGADVANSLMYFQHLLGSNVTAEQFYVTSIAAGHGQAFDGFLHMTENTYQYEHPGASELFRAHEVAHSWWGHKVGWKTYRDQWLSEAFAEYSAMLFVKHFVKGGDRYFDEILRSYDGIVKGNFAGGFSKFNRPWLIERNGFERKRVGPIGHGWRASTAEIPAGYVIQAYHKGPLVIHMLRMIIAMRLGSDEAFFTTLKEFLAEYDGRAASTEDFRRVLERNLDGSDMSWFFDAWIYRNEIPSYTWSSRVEPEGDGFLLTVEIERRDVPDDFVAVVPLALEFPGKKIGYVLIANKERTQTVTQKLPARPLKVVFAPESSLLASVKGR